MPGYKATLGFRVEIIIEPDGDSFHSYCPALKGLHSCGDTEEEAVQNAKDAAVAYLMSSIKHGDPIPVGIIIREGRKEVPTKYSTYRTEDLKVPCAI